MTIKLVTIDIDGTLLNNNHEILPEVKETIQQKRAEGVQIVLASGRPLIGMLDYVKELDLTSDTDYIISYNGSLVLTAGSHEVMVKHVLTHDEYIEIEALSRQIGSHLHVEDMEAIYTANRNISPYTILESHLTNMPIRYRTVEEMDPDMMISKMMLIDEPDILDAAEKKIPASLYDKYTFVKSMPYFLEVLNKEASKGNALHDLAQRLGIKQEETMAIGDNENDISMLQYAGIGVAMGNATDKTKQYADKISLTNEEAGVAYALKTWA